jgi:hypothetical protein
MLIPKGRRVMELALVLCAIGTITACAPQSHTSGIQRVSYPLVINNRSDFEVVVYAMASGRTRGQRLGTARPFSTTRLSIPEHALQSMDLFAVQLHAIGAPRGVPNWVSTGTVLTDGLMAKLDIMGDMSGNLRYSSLSAHIVR